MRARLPKEPRTYAERDLVLYWLLGHRTYRAYLHSPLWHRVRQAGFRRHGRRCKGCNAPAHTLHHNSYGAATLQGTDLSRLVPVCKRCHDKIELKHDGSKRTFAQAKAACKRLLRAARTPSPSPRSRVGGTMGVGKKRKGRGKAVPSAGYKWKQWFEAGMFSLRRGTDYACTTNGMLAQVRNRASALGCAVKVTEHPDGLGFDVNVTRRGAPRKPARPRGRPRRPPTSLFL